MRWPKSMRPRIPTPNSEQPAPASPAAVLRPKDRHNVEQPAEVDNGQRFCQIQELTSSTQNRRSYCQTSEDCSKPWHLQQSKHSTDSSTGQTPCHGLRKSSVLPVWQSTQNTQGSAHSARETTISRFRKHSRSTFKRNQQ